MPVIERTKRATRGGGGEGERDAGGLTFSVPPLPTSAALPLPSSLPDLLPGLPPVDVIERQLDLVQQEMDGLRAELDAMRRRDDTLNVYMRRLDEELRLAARLQQDFLPKSLPRVGPVRFAALFRPAGYVSGDLYDVMRLDERHVGFYVADAVGHGMPAALLTMFLKNALVTKDITAAGYRLLDPGEALGRLNRALIEQDLSQSTFATAVYGTVNVATRELRMAKAGHPAPLVFRGGCDGGSGGAIDALESAGSLLGIFPDEPFETVTRRLDPGDRLCVYTDGVEVAFGDDEAADPARWRDELARRRAMDAESQLAELARLIDQEGGSIDPRDDLTILTVEVA